MARFSFCGGTYQSRSPNFNAEFCMNRYPERAPSENARSAMALIPVEGLSIFASLPAGSGQSVPGGFSFNGRAFCVGVIIATQQMHLYEIPAAGGALIDRGAIGAPVNSSPAVWAANPNQVVFTVAGTGKIYVFTLATNAITIVNTYQDTGGQFSAATVLYLDGFFVAFLANSSNFQVSNLEDGTTWLGINIAGVSRFPDNIISMKATQETLWLIGRKAAAPYYNSGGLFPFVPVPGTVVEEGSGATYGIEKLDNTIFWIGSHDDQGNAVAWRMNGYTPQRISTHDVEQAWQTYTRIDDAIAYTYQIRGHKFIAWYFPTANATWVYDVSTSLWHQQGTWTPNANPPAFTARHIQWHAFAFNKHLVGDWQSGNIYLMSPANVTDNGLAIRRVRRSPYIAKEHDHLFHHLLELLCETGLGPGIQAPSDYLLNLFLQDPSGQVWQVQISDAGVILPAFAAAGAVPSNPILADSINQSTFWNIQITTGGAVIGVPIAYGRPDVAILNLSTNQTFLDGGLQVDQNGNVTAIQAQAHIRAPQVSMRFSDDSAHSWSNYRQQSLGLPGEYQKRVLFNRLGKSRNRVYEVVDEDPVAIVWVDAFVKGSSGAAVERMGDQMRKQA